MKEQQFNKITEWQNKTFGKATPLSKMAHLKEEFKELKDEIITCEGEKEWMCYSESSKKKKEMEFADCFILLFGVAASDGMSYNDICKCIEEKMEINYNRKWKEPNKDGVVNHIE